MISSFLDFLIKVFSSTFFRVYVLPSLPLSPSLSFCLLPTPHFEMPTSRVHQNFSTLSPSLTDSLSIPSRARLKDKNQKSCFLLYLLFCFVFFSILYSCFCSFFFFHRLIH